MAKTDLLYNVFNGEVYIKGKDGKYYSDKYAKAHPNPADWVRVDATASTPNLKLVTAKEYNDFILSGANSDYNNYENKITTAEYKKTLKSLKDRTKYIVDADHDGSVTDEPQYKAINKLASDYEKKGAPLSDKKASEITALITHAAPYAQQMKKLAGGKGIQDIDDGNKSNDEMKQYKAALASYSNDIKKLNALGDHSLDANLKEYTTWQTTKAYKTTPLTDQKSGTTGTTTGQAEQPKTQPPKKSDENKGKPGTTADQSQSDSLTSHNPNSTADKTKDKSDATSSSSNSLQDHKKDTVVTGGGTSGQTQANNPANPAPKNSNAEVADKLNDDTEGQVYVLGRFEKAFGADGANHYRKAVNAMLANDPTNIKIVDNKAGGNFSVKVKDSKGNWTGATDVVTASLSKHINFTGVDPQTQQDHLLKLGTDGSALERHILARYEKAYGAAEGKDRMYAATDAAIAANPDKVKEFGTRGQAGYFVAVKDSKGNWSSRGENVIDVLSKFDGGAASTSEQKAILGNASGSGKGTTVMKDFIAIYQDPEVAQNAFFASIDGLAKAKPGSVREFGTRGTPGFYVEVKTKDGWVGNTNKVTDVLAKYAPSKDEAAKLSSKNTPATSNTSAPVPGQTNTSNSQPGNQTNAHDPDKDNITNKYDLWNNTAGVPGSINNKSELTNAREDLTRQLAAARAANNPDLQDDIVALEGNLAEVNNRLEVLEASIPDSDNDKIADKYDVWDHTVGVPKSVDTLKELTAKRDQLTAKIAAASGQNKNWLQDDIAGLQSNLADVNSKIAAKNAFQSVSGNINVGSSSPEGQAPALTTAPAAAPSAAPAPTPPPSAAYDIPNPNNPSNSQPGSQTNTHDPDKDNITNKYDLWNNTAGVPGSINNKSELTNAREDLTRQLAAARAANNPDLQDDIVALEGNLAEVDNRLDVLEASVPDSDNDKIANDYDIWDKTAGVPESVNTLEELNAKKDQLNAKIAAASARNKNWLQDDIAGLQANLNEVNVRISHKTVPTGISGTADASAGPLPDQGQVATQPDQLQPSAPAPAAAPPAPDPAAAAAATQAELVAAADRNDTGKLSANEIEKFEALADADASGEVTSAEAQAYALIDTNNNGKIGKKELQAYREIDTNGNGISRDEAEAALARQVSNNQSKRTHDLAQEYLNRNPALAGGGDAVDAAASALVTQNKTESSLKKKKKK